MKKKTTKKLTDSAAARTTRVMELLCMGLNPTEILTFINTKIKPAWNTKPPELGKLIKKARGALMELAKYDETLEMGQALARLNQIYKRSVLIHDYKTALAAQKERNRLLNLGPEARAEPGTLTTDPGERPGALPKTDPRDHNLFNAIEDAFGYLAAGTGAGYIDLIKLAAIIIKEKKPIDHRKPARLSAAQNAGDSGR